MLAVAAAALTWTIIGAGLSSVGVVHDLARNTIDTVISKIDSKATTEELPASQTIPRAAPSVLTRDTLVPWGL